ncbi:MAG: hypothetical protein H6797_05870 [Candidatus Nomurabacteria bacterium]|nr:MAG: hypothetical protein H6797_05870 [Candidatus Nomurabacteria bacterium]
MLRNIRYKIAITFISLAAFTLLPVSYVNAAPTVASSAGGSNPCGGSITIFPHWYDGLCKSDGSIKSPNEVGSGDTGKRFGTWLTIIAMNIVDMLLYVVGYASLIFIIWGGFKYMTQGDNSSGTVAARKTIQNAIIGLVISIMAIAIVQFIAGSIK